MMRSTLYPANNPIGSLQVVLADDPAVEKIIPTTEAQKEIWLACELGGNQAGLSYNQSYTIQFTGNLNIVALYRSIEILIARHEALRSTFNIDGQQSRVYKQLPVEIHKIDLTGLPSEARDEHFSDFLHADSLQEFDLYRGPLFRFKLHAFSSVESKLTFTLHHIIADGWSINVILKDLAKLYSSLAQDEEPSLPIPAQISEYVADEIEYKKGDQFKKTENFWLKTFENNNSNFTLPTDFPRKAYRTYESKRIDLTLDQKLTEKVKQFGIQHQCSLPTVLISAFEIFLYQITFHKSVVVGLPTSGQVSQEKYGLVGHCANLLPLTSKITRSEPYLTYLKKRRSELFDAYEHQNLTFGELIKKMQITRDHSRANLVPVVLNIDTSVGDQLSFHDLTHKILTNPKSHEVFEVFLNVSLRKEETVFEWTFNSNLFLEETIQKYHRLYSTLLERIITKPTSNIGEIIHEGQNHLVNKPVEKTLTQLLYEATEKFSQHTALRYQGKSLSYNKLNKSSNQFANYLIKKGICPGDPVGISCFRSINTLVALLGIIKAGACYVPIDSSLPPERINYILQNANIKLLLDEKWLSHHIEASQIFDSDNLMLEASGDDAIYILHTSGSTGVPKGVCMGDTALVNLILWQIENSAMKSQSRTLQYSALSFDVSFQEIFATLLSGGELILIEEDNRKDPKELLEYIDTHQINRLFMPFVALQSLADTAINNQLFPDSLRELITAGEQLKVTEHIRKFFSKLPNCTLSNQYGPTECHVVSELKLRGDSENWPHLPSIGKEIYNTRIYLLDQNLQEVLPGEIGELCISGFPLAEGYINQPEITSSKFITFIDKKGEHIRIYKTGDLAKRLPNSVIEFLGRQDFQVKIRGYRVELGEIEHHIIAQPSVKDAIVTSFENTPGNLQLVAYLIRKDRTNDIKQIKQALQQFLPDYMIPQEYIELQEFPKTLSGKIDRKKLPQPEILKISSDKQNLNQLLTPLQQKVIGVWETILNSRQLTLESNFFEEGGHSLTAIQVLIELEKETGTRPPLTSVFKYPRLLDFAKLYEPTSVNGDEPFHVSESATISNAEIIEVPILETQSEVWVSSILGGDASNKSYNISSAHLLHGELNVDKFNKSIHTVVGRHQSLRTTFNDDGSAMLIHKQVPVTIEHQNLTGLSSHEQDKELKRYSLEVSEAPFDLHQGNLFRLSLLKLTKESYYFIFTVHHLVCDGYSINILLKEISIIYNALQQNKSIELSPAPSLLAYANQKNKFYLSDAYHQIKNYWLTHTPSHPPALHLPYDFQRPVNKGYKGACLHANLPVELVEKVNQFNIEHKSSFSLTMRILFEVFLYHITKQSEFIVGQLSSDQLHNSKEGLVGHCVNLLPIFCKINEQQSFSEHFEQRKLELIQAYSNQSVTLGSIVKEMNLKRNAHIASPISVVFNSLIGIDINLELSQIESELYRFDSRTEKFDLTLNLYGSEKNPLFEWNYSTELFKEESIQIFIESFQQLTNELISDRSKELGSLLIEKKRPGLLDRLLSIIR